MTSKFLNLDKSKNAFVMGLEAVGKLPEKLKHLKLESVKLNHHEKLKIYGVSNRIDFKTSGQRNVCQ